VHYFSLQRRLGFWLFIAIAGFYLLSEHRAHLMLGAPYLPFLILILAVCPLIHLFGHRGHGGHGGEPQQRSPGDNASPPTADGEQAAGREPAAGHRHEGGIP
jgi:hypothetical protein